MQASSLMVRMALGRSARRSWIMAGVRNVLLAFGWRTVRIALMTATGVTNRTGSYDRSNESHDWKRRAEWLMRASGCPYTTYVPDDSTTTSPMNIICSSFRLQGDTRQAGNSSDGVISRRQIAEVLVSSLTSDEALRKTPRTGCDQGTGFAEFDPDPNGSVDGVRDLPNQPFED